MFNTIDNYRDKIFNAGIYLRLSKEDEKYRQSESITSQKDFLTSYVLEHGWNIEDYYIDDGYSGTNFDRPDFIRMKKDIENGRINLVITKDYSRLGRDYIETGYYLEKYFPSKGIRYIGVKDNIDSFSSNSNNDMSPFLGVMNDMYARDISKKVRTTIDFKRENGKFIGAFAPYGYKKDKEDKNKLVVDDIAAKIVKRIYSMYLSGYGYTYIANTLNNEGILSPSKYKQLKSNYRSKSNGRMWVNETIKQILSNPTYTGNLAQHKYKKINYKIKKLQKVPRKYWIVVENTHKEIIDMYTYNLVQDLKKSKSTGYQKNTKINHLLSGLVYCGDCGSRMTFSRTPTGFFYCICSKYKRHGSEACSRHSIKEEQLNKYIINDLRLKSTQVIDLEKILEIIKKEKIKNHKNGMINEIADTEKKLSIIKKTIKSLYIDKLKGIVSESDFMDFSKDFNEERDILETRLETLKSQIDRTCKQLKEDDITKVKSIVRLEEVTKVMILELVEKIEIFDDNTIKIHYRFMNPI